MRPAIFAICLGLAGCQTDFMGYGSPVITTSPSASQVAYCREVMYINPQLEIEPLGFFLRPSMDDVIRFKFIAKTSDPSCLFDSGKVDPNDFSKDLDVSILDPQSSEPWWNVSSKKLTGGDFEVPPPKATGTRGLNIGYEKNDDETLTVYVMWFET